MVSPLKQEGPKRLPAGLRAALRAAARGAGRVAPNPIVGAAVAAPDGRVVRAAGHSRFGGPHAEARLLGLRHGPAGAGRVLPSGSILYVTLEPCRHRGKTPPCVEAILAARPARVIVSTLDPDPRVRGKGVALLRRGGIPVDVGMGEREALGLNLAFHLYHRLGRSLVCAKLASTLDARLAADDGGSRWISGEMARRHAHGERSRADAVLTGSGTVRKDNPRLNVRLVRGPSPSRIVLDSGLQTDPRCRLWRSWREEVPDGPSSGQAWGNFRETRLRGRIGYRREARLILATGQGWGESRLAAYRRLGWEIWELPQDRTENRAGLKGRGRRGERPKISLRGLVRRSAREGLLRLLVEAGPGLVGAFLARDLVDEFSLYLAPMVLGGRHSWPAGWAAAGIGRGRRYSVVGERALREDRWLHLRKAGILEKARLDVHGAD